MLESLDALPPDPILGISVAHSRDSNPLKIDIGVGVYKDAQGRTPIMQAVKSAERLLLEEQQSKTYAPACGTADFVTLYNQLAFGAKHPIFAESRLASAQTPGGCGALRVAAELVLRANPAATIWIPNPTWGNHRPLLGHAGVALQEYRYYDPAQRRLEFAEMMADLSTVKPGDLVLLHGCCHNPTGADLNPEQWQAVANLALEKGFTPFIDMAYQGMGIGLAEDAYGLRLLAEKVPELILVGSCSKNFGIYCERAGAISVISDSVKSTNAIQSQLANIIRGIYSTPPTHGALVVTKILGDSALTKLWQEELEEVRQRIASMRTLLTEKLHQQSIAGDFSFIEQQQGMFSLLGISPEQAQQLREEHSVYLTDDSRMSIAGINSDNVDRLASAIAAVLAAN